MVTRTQKGNGLPGLFHTLSEGSRHHGQEADSEEACSQQVLSLDEIRVIPGTNEYTEGPGQRTPELSSQKSEVEPCGPDNEERQYLIQGSQQSDCPAQSPEAAAQTSQTGSSGPWTDARKSSYSSSLEQGLLGTPQEDHMAGGPPEPAELKQGRAKAPSGKVSAEHERRCVNCGRCVCEACVHMRRLPSCWVCGRRCLCSLENVVEYGTCVCCVKGLFYHCSSDDEDMCADEPFSCEPSHRCARWSAIGALSLFLPCLLCYLPLRGCLKISQACYDRARRPGCRCKTRKGTQSKPVQKPA